MKKFLKLNLPLAFVGLFAFSSALLAEHHGHSDLRDYGAKLKQAVEDGKLSKQDAWAKWMAAARKKKEEHHAKGEHDGGHDKKDWGHRGHDKKDRHDGHDSHSDLREYGEKLKHAVEDGKLSKEDAWAKWKAAAQKMKGDHHEKGGHDKRDWGHRDHHGKHDKKDWGHRGHGDKDRHEGHDSHSELREYGEKLKHAVEEGKLSKEDAWAK